MVESNRQPRVAQAAGVILRQIRVERKLSLRQVTIRSDGRFKPSSVASYERGERQLSLERLFELAGVYEVAPESIVAVIRRRLESSREERDARSSLNDGADVRAQMIDARS